MLSPYTFSHELGAIAQRMFGGPGHERFVELNSFFEHLGLIGDFLLLVWLNLKEDRL
jgi:hypothetical protein